jgi:CRISPR system Cascade subunit CasC
MLIQIHAIQNHSPANLNRDDLGAPKSCYFGGVLRSRISSQCLKRSIRMSDEFSALLGGVRTRQLAGEIARECNGDKEIQKRAEKILELCGLKPKKGKKGQEDASEISKSLVYTTRDAIKEMAELLTRANGKEDAMLAKELGDIISKRVSVPDMALSGRMLETGVLTDTTVEGALQAAHAISTHAAHPEVDYYVAADDVPGEDAGAGFVDEAMFSSACFYKYFSINWRALVRNLEGYGPDHEKLAAHTVGAFIRGAALVNPTGKQNSFAAHNPPDGIMVEFRNIPISYANAFADPVPTGAKSDIIKRSIEQFAQYVHDIDAGYGSPDKRLWFSPNLRHSLTVSADGKNEVSLTEDNITSLDALVAAVVSTIGFDWESVKQVILNHEVGS